MISCLANQECFDIVAGLGIGKRLVDAVDGVVAGERTNGVVQLGMRAEECHVVLDIADRILRGADDVQGLEGDHLGLDGDAAAVGILAGDEVDPAIAQDLHALRDGGGCTRGLEGEIHTEAVGKRQQSGVDGLGRLTGEVKDPLGAQIAGELLAGVVVAGGDGVDMLDPHGVQVHHGVGAHGAKALHHGGVDALELHAGKVSQRKCVHSGGTGAGEDAHHGGIQIIRDLDEVCEGGVIDLSIAAPKIGSLLDAAAVGHAHVDAVGVVTALAEQAFAAGNGDVGDHIVADLEAVPLPLALVEIDELAHKLVADDRGSSHSQLAVVKMEIGAADAACDQLGAAVAGGGGGHVEFADLKGLMCAHKDCCFCFVHVVFFLYLI